MVTPQLRLRQICHDFRASVARRREQMFLLGSLFAGLGLFLQNLLSGKVPEALAWWRDHAFLAHALAMLVPALLIAARIALIYREIVVNGVWFAYAEAQSRRPPFDPVRVSRLNWRGVSMLLFLLTDLVAGFETMLFLLALGVPTPAAACVAVLLFLAFLIGYVRLHRNACALALRTIHHDPAALASIAEDDYYDHLEGSLDDCQADMLATLAFVALMMFSILERLAGLSEEELKAHAEIASRDIQLHGPIVCAVLLVGTCAMGVMIYLRLTEAALTWSRRLVESGSSVRPFAWAESGLGYGLLAFFLAFATHMLVASLSSPAVAWGADVLVLAAGAALYAGVIRSHGATRARPI